MRVDIVIPSSGESVKEGDIARWFKESGDFVELDEPLLELETDKASLEITADAAGRLNIDVPVGTTVQVGEVVGHIDTEAKPEDKPAGEPDKLEDTAPGEPAKEALDFEGDELDRAKHQTVFNLALPSPAARKLIAENRLSAKDISGSGRDGRLTKADVLQYLDKLQREEATRTERPAEPEPKAAPTPESVRLPAEPPLKAAETSPAKAEASAPGAREERREKMSRIRKTIAERLLKTTQELAMLTTFNEVDMSGIMGIRAKYKESFKEKHQVGLGFMSFFTKAVCLAIEEFPVVNAMVDGDEIVYHDYCDIGIAVSTPRGLVVPCIRNAEELSFHEIEGTIVDLATKGRDGKLSIDDLRSGTFTITNGGIFGSMLSTPLINYPQSAILGMHNIVQRPVAVDGQVVIRPMMYVALSYDHRIIDGADAVRFLVRVKEALEDPMRLMLQV